MIMRIDIIAILTSGSLLIGCVGTAPEAFDVERGDRDSRDAAIAIQTDASPPVDMENGRFDGSSVSVDAGPEVDTGHDENGRAHDASPSDDVEPVDPVPEDELDDGRD